MAILGEDETLAKLDREPKVKIRIAGDKNNANYVTERVFVNGVCIQIPVGEFIEVPETVADLLAKKGVI